MPEITLAELHAKADAKRPENTYIRPSESDTKIGFYHIINMSPTTRDQYLDAFEKFLLLSVDETANRETRRAADKAAGRKVGSTKAKQDGDEADKTFTPDDAAATISAFRDGLVDVDRMGSACADLMLTAAIDKRAAKKFLDGLDVMARATLVEVHMNAMAQGE